MTTNSSEELPFGNQDNLPEMNSEKIAGYTAQLIQQSQLIQLYQNQIAQLQMEKEDLINRVDEIYAQQGFEEAMSDSLANSANQLFGKEFSVELEVIKNSFTDLKNNISDIQTKCNNLENAIVGLQTLLTREMSNRHNISNKTLLSNNYNKKISSVKGSIIAEDTNARTTSGFDMETLKKTNFLPSNSAGTSINTKVKEDGSKEIYTNKSVTSFYFCGQFYKVNYWIDLLAVLAETLAKKHEDEFDRCLELKGSKNSYFSRNKNRINVPKLVKGTNIYMETKLSAQNIYSICFKLIDLFGYKDSDLRIELQRK